MRFTDLRFRQIESAEELITDPKKQKKVYKYWRIRMFAGMYIGYCVFYFTRKNLTPALPLISEKLDISLMELGILSSAFYIVYGLGKFISGLLADRANIRTFMAIGLFCASVIHLFFGYLNSLYLLIFFWSLNGLFQSMGFPPIAKGLVHWFSASERATKWTILSSSHTAGTFTIGIIIAGIIALYHKGMLSWQAIFYVPGIIGILTSIFLVIALRDRPVSLGLPPIEEFKNDVATVELDAKEISHFSILKKYIFKNPYIWLLGLSNTFIYVVRFGTLDWATKFMYDVKGIDQVSVAIFWTLMPLAGIPGGIIAGYLADKFWNGRCTPINIIYLTLLSFSIYGFFIFSGPDHFLVTGILLLCIGFFVDGPQNLISGVQASRVTVKEAIATANGMTGLFGYLGATFSGIGLAYVTTQYGWGAMYGICICCCVIAGVLNLFVWKKEKASM